MSSGTRRLVRRWTLFNLPAGTNRRLRYQRCRSGHYRTRRVAARSNVQTVIANPTAYHFYRGFDILFFTGTDNILLVTTRAAIRTLVFNYFVTDLEDCQITPVALRHPYATDTAAAGMKSISR